MRATEKCWAVCYKDWMGEWKTDRHRFATRKGAAVRLESIKRRKALNGQATVQNLR